MQAITPFFWFDKQAEEAAQFYTEIFPNSRIIEVARYRENTPGQPGTVMTVSFELNGQPFTALNGGAIFQMTPAISFVVHCDSQAEIDHYWEKLSEGGQIQQCGWLTDKYGVTWQIVPRILASLLNDPDPEKSRRVTQAMLQMIKLDIPTLLAA